MDYHITFLIGYKYREKIIFLLSTLKESKIVEVSISNYNKKIKEEKIIYQLEFTNKVLANIEDQKIKVFCLIDKKLMFFLNENEKSVIALETSGKIIEIYDGEDYDNLYSYMVNSSRDIN